jgi:hypothetical protein
VQAFVRGTNDHGTIAYMAGVSDATATEGIFRTDGKKTVAIARNDSLTPTGGMFESLFDPVINNRGQVAFSAEMTGGTADFAVFRGDGRELTPVFAANQAAPGGGAFLDFGDPVINANGQVAAVALLNGASSTGLFIGDGNDAVAIVLEGQPAPSGGNYARAADKPLRLNDRGDVAFNIALTGGTSSRGIFRGNGGYTRTIALTGTIAPGTTGTFESFGDLRLDNDGRVAFIARLALGVGGVDLSNNMGIWVGTSRADLQLVVRTGDVIGGNVLTRLPAQIGQLDMNADGVVWIGRFASGATAVVFSRVRDDNEDRHDRD